MGGSSSWTSVSSSTCSPNRSRSFPKNRGSSRAKGAASQMACPLVGGTGGVFRTYGGRGVRHHRLAANVPIALLQQLLERIGKLFEGPATGRLVGVDRTAAFASQQLVDGQAGPFPQDVPQSRVDPAEGVVQDRSVAPVGTEEGGLPDVFDVPGTLAHQKLLQIDIHGCLHGANPLGEGGATQAVQFGFAGRDLDYGQPASGGRREDALDIGDLDGRQSGTLLWSRQQGGSGGRRPQGTHSGGQDPQGTGLQQMAAFHDSIPPGGMGAASATVTREPTLFVWNTKRSTLSYHGHPGFS